MIQSDILAKKKIGAGRLYAYTTLENPEILNIRI